MKNALIILLILVGISGCLLAQTAASDKTTSDKWTVGTIVEVTPYGATADDGSETYDISIKVAGTIFVVRYTAPPGRNVQYRKGFELPVLVGSKMLTFNDMLGKLTEVPILSRRTVPTK